MTVAVGTFTGEDGKLYARVRYRDSEDVVGPLENGVEDVAILMPSDPNGIPTIKAKKNRRRAMQCEEAIAKDLGGKRHKGSGSLSYLKGDVRVKDRFRIESKFTRLKSYRITLADLEKIRSECSGDEVPMFDITWVDPRTTSVIEEWVLVPRSVFTKEK